MSVNITDVSKKKKKGSKNTKKGWRKNTDIEEVENFLDEKRFEERLGGSFAERQDDELFVVETAPEEAEEESSVSKKKKRRGAKPLKCFKILEITDGVADPKKGRNTRRSEEQRKNPIVVEMEKKLQQQGVVK